MAKIVSADNIQAWLDKLTASYEVFAPVEGESSSSFKQVKAGEKPALDARIIVSPKGAVYKQVEKTLSYNKGENGYEIEEAPAGETTKVVFGIRPCDARAFTLIDKVFVDSAMPENQYAESRKQSALIINGCTSACNTCFCTSVNGSPADKAGDVFMVKLGDRYLVEALTPTGEKMVAAGESLMSNASADDEAAAKKIADDVAASMPKLQTPDPKKLDRLFTDEAFWSSLSEKCQSCGACTFLCPTCFCFDVRDEGTLGKGDRYRRWDSCMFYQYNRAAGGHNPRDKHWKRMRQRMLHKFCYAIDNTGDYSCVGCGRCIRSCPVSYDLRDFLSKALVATGGANLDFEQELSTEPEELLECEMPQKDESKTGVGSDV